MLVVFKIKLFNYSKHYNQNTEFSLNIAIAADLVLNHKCDPGLEHKTSHK